MLVEKGWDPAMGARPLRRAIQRYVEDPLADFVLRSQVPVGLDGARRHAGPRPEDGADEPEVKLTVIEPAPKPTPVGVGAEGGGGDEDADESAHDPEPGADDAPSDAE